MLPADIFNKPHGAGYRVLLKVQFANKSKVLHQFEAYW